MDDLAEAGRDIRSIGRSLAIEGQLEAERKRELSWLLLANGAIPQRSHQRRRLRERSGLCRLPRFREPR